MEISNNDSANSIERSSPMSTYSINQRVKFPIILGLLLLLLVVVSAGYHLETPSNPRIKTTNTYSINTITPIQAPILTLTPTPTLQLTSIPPLNLTQIPIDLSQTRTPTPTSTLQIHKEISTSPDITSTWNTYSNAVHRFTIKYPKKIDRYPETWQYEEWKNGVAFGTPSSKIGGYIWIVSIFDDQIVEELIKNLGYKYLDRKELRQNININGVPALLVTVMTEKYIANAVYIQRGNKIYVIGRSDNLVEFEAFYNSFRFSQ